MVGKLDTGSGAVLPPSTEGAGGSPRARVETARMIGDGKVRASPVARKLAAEAGIDLAARDWERAPGEGSSRRTSQPRRQAAPPRRQTVRARGGEWRLHEETLHHEACHRRGHGEEPGHPRGRGARLHHRRRAAAAPPRHERIGRGKGGPARLLRQGRGESRCRSTRCSAPPIRPSARNTGLSRRRRSASRWTRRRGSSCRWSKNPAALSVVEDPRGNRSPDRAGPFARAFSSRRSAGAASRSRTSARSPGCTATR